MEYGCTAYHGYKNAISGGDFFVVLATLFLYQDKGLDFFFSEGVNFGFILLLQEEGFCFFACGLKSGAWAFPGINSIHPIYFWEKRSSVWNMRKI